MNSKITASAEQLAWAYMFFRITFTAFMISLMLWPLASVIAATYSSILLIWFRDALFFVLLPSILFVFIAQFLAASRLGESEFFAIVGFPYFFLLRFSDPNSAHNLDEKLRKVLVEKGWKVHLFTATKG